MDYLRTWEKRNVWTFWIFQVKWFERVTAVRPLKEERELAMATCGFNTNMRTLSTNLFHCKQDWNLAKKCVISFIEKLVHSRNLHVLFSCQIYQIYRCSGRFKSSRCTLHTLELYCCHSRRSADFIATVWTAFFGWFVAIPVILAFIIIRRAEFGWRSKRRTNSWPRYSCKVFWRQHFKRRRSKKIDLLRYIEEVLECTYDKGNHEIPLASMEHMGERFTAIKQSH